MLHEQITTAVPEQKLRELFLWAKNKEPNKFSCLCYSLFQQYSVGVLSAEQFQEIFADSFEDSKIATDKFLSIDPQCLDLVISGEYLQQDFYSQRACIIQAGLDSFTADPHSATVFINELSYRIETINNLIQQQAVRFDQNEIQQLLLPWADIIQGSYIFPTTNGNNVVHNLRNVLAQTAQLVGGLDPALIERLCPNITTDNNCEVPQKIKEQRRKMIDRLRTIFDCDPIDIEAWLQSAQQTLQHPSLEKLQELTGTERFVGNLIRIFTTDLGLTLPLSLNIAFDRPPVDANDASGDPYLASFPAYFNPFLQKIGVDAGFPPSTILAQLSLHEVGHAAMNHNIPPSDDMDHELYRLTYQAIPNPHEEIVSICLERWFTQYQELLGIETQGPTTRKRLLAGRALADIMRNYSGQSAQQVIDLLRRFGNFSRDEIGRIIRYVDDNPGAYLLGHFVIPEMIYQQAERKGYNVNQFLHWVADEYINNGAFRQCSMVRTFNQAPDMGPYGEAQQASGAWKRFAQIAQKLPPMSEEQIVALARVKPEAALLRATDKQTILTILRNLTTSSHSKIEGETSPPPEITDYHNLDFSGLMQTLEEKTRREIERIFKTYSLVDYFPILNMHVMIEEMMLVLYVISHRSPEIQNDHGIKEHLLAYLNMQKNNLLEVDLSAYSGNQIKRLDDFFKGTADMLSEIFEQITIPDDLLLEYHAFRDALRFYIPNRIRSTPPTEPKRRPIAHDIQRVENYCIDLFDKPIDDIQTMIRYWLMQHMQVMEEASLPRDQIAATQTALNMTTRLPHILGMPLYPTVGVLPSPELYASTATWHTIPAKMHFVLPSPVDQKTLVEFVAESIVSASDEQESQFLLWANLFEQVSEYIAWRDRDKQKDNDPNITFRHNQTSCDIGEALLSDTDVRKFIEESAGKGNLNQIIKRVEEYFKQKRQTQDNAQLIAVQGGQEKIFSALASSFEEIGGRVGMYFEMMSMLFNKLPTSNPVRMFLCAEQTTVMPQNSPFVPPKDMNFEQIGYREFMTNVTRSVLLNLIPDQELIDPNIWEILPGIAVHEQFHGYREAAIQLAQNQHAPSCFAYGPHHESFPTAMAYICLKDIFERADLANAYLMYNMTRALGDICTNTDSAFTVTNLADLYEQTLQHAGAAWYLGASHLSIFLSNPLEYVAYVAEFPEWLQLYNKLRDMNLSSVQAIQTLTTLSRYKPHWILETIQSNPKYLDDLPSFFDDAD
ncbi:hypothetical protein KC726_02005 [Candidatus Woesebacteria bacterium]|nr:hypothetical protein [Candidatus Woesebacteria bacterium]